MAFILAEPLMDLEQRSEYRQEVQEAHAVTAIARLPLAQNVQEALVFCANLGYSRLEGTRRDRFHSELISALSTTETPEKTSRAIEVLYDGVLSVARKLPRSDAEVLMALLDRIDAHPNEPVSATSEMFKIAESVHREQSLLA